MRALLVFLILIAGCGGGDRSANRETISLISTSKYVDIEQIVQVTQNTSYPADVVVRVSKGGGFRVAAGKTLTLNGPVQAGRHQIFHGQGEVVGMREVFPEWWGAVGDGIADDQPACQAAIDSVYASGGGTVRLAPRTYLLASVTAPYYLLRLRDKVSVIGSGPSSVLRAAKGMRSAERGTCILYNHTELVSDLCIRDLTIDYNGEENPIRQEWLEHPAHSTLSVQRTGGDIAQRVTIERVHFKNGAGYHFIWLGTYGRDARNEGCKVTGCTFEEAGGAIAGNHATDHSSVYSAGKDALISDNTFRCSKKEYVATAIEVHGPGVRVIGNEVENYNTGIIVSADDDHTYDVQVQGNVVRHATIGVGIWHAGAFTLDSVRIADNRITLQDTEEVPGTPYIPSQGIYYSGAQDKAAVNASNISIVGNRISQASIYTGAFAWANTGITMDPVRGLEIRGNMIRDMKGDGIVVFGKSGRMGSHYVIEDNVIVACGYTSAAGRKRGIAITTMPTDTVSPVSVSRNRIVAGVHGAAVAMEYGIYFSSGNFPSTEVTGNFVQGATMRDIYK